MGDVSMLVEERIKYSEKSKNISTKKFKKQEQKSPQTFS